MKKITASLIVAAAMGAILFASAGAEAQNAAAKAKAKKFFDKGVASMEAHDYKAALESFDTAYKASPHWMVLGHIGNCWAKLGEPAKAIESYEKYLEEGGSDISPDEREAARKSLADQRKKVGTVHLLVKPKGTEVRIDGVSIGQAPFEELLLKAGPHHLIAIREGDEEERDIDVVAGQEQTIKMYPANEADGAVVAAPVPAPAPAPAAEEPKVEEPKAEEPKAEEPAPEPTPAEPPADGSVSVSANVDTAKVLLDGQEKGTVPFDTTLPPGPHRLDVTADGYVAFGQDLAIQSNLLTAVDVRLASVADKPDPFQWPLWVAVGGAGAGLIGAGVGFGLMAYNQNSADNYQTTIDDLQAAPQNATDGNRLFSYATCQQVWDSGSVPTAWDTSDTEVWNYYCGLESDKRDFESNADMGMYIGIAGSALFVVGGTMSALLFFFPEWFYGGADSSATLTVTPITTAEQSGLVFSGSF